ncbi:MAG TPA: hypothetical protein VI916_13355 [Acidimicrobiia bacterium]|nr:hypothetical protein [Acidimicrobiia bacterium]
MTRIGAALSGGGHRATAWGVGALAALVETGASADVVSVSSVSGGSIANGFVAASGDFREQHVSARFADVVRPLLQVVARDGLFFPGTATRGYVIRALGSVALIGLVGVGLLAALIAAGRETRLIGYVIAGLVAGAVIGWKLGGPVRRRRVVVTAVAGVATGLTALLGAGLTSGMHGTALWVVLTVLGVTWLLLVWIALVLLSQRGKAVERALARTLLAHPADGRPLTLADVVSGVNHVLCATDLESGDHFYMAPRFLYGYREGTSTTAPATVTLAAAVQASAALPGAFPPAIIETGPFVRDPSITNPSSSPQRVVLSDGGVYDNMAEQWEAGLEARLRRCPQLAKVQEPADVLLVANASEDWEWNPFTARGRVSRELLGLLRDQGIQYDVSTARRRAQFFERFHANRLAGRGPVGVIVMVDRSPLSLAAPFARGDDAVAQRAREAVDFVLAQRSDEAWTAMAQHNAQVPTTLGPIGVEAALDLMEHAFTSTVVGLYVLCGLGVLAPFPRATYAAVLDDQPKEA